jgi:opacity protein-like surface antigen
MPTRMERLAGMLAWMTLASLCASGARAASGDGGWYVAAGYGAAPRLFLRSEIDDALVDAFSEMPLTLESSSVSKRNTTWSAGVGYWFAENLAVEAAYLNVGKVHYRSAGSALVSETSEATSLDLVARSRGATLALVWAAPLWNAWGVDARAGAFRGKTSSQFVSVLGEEESADSVSKTSTVPLLGAGGSFAATTHLVVKLNYVHLFGIKEAAVADKFDADLVTLGLTYVF